MEDFRRVAAAACGIGTARSSSTASYACSTGVGQGHKEIGDSGERPSYSHAQESIQGIHQQLMVISKIGKTVGC